MKEKNLCFTGHRREKLPEDLTELTILLENEIEKSILDGYTTFYHGACYGFDLLCSKILSNFKHKYDITVIAVVPYENQSKSWSNEDKLEYFNCLEESDEVVLLSQKYTPGCFHKRNRYMVDNSSKIIAYCTDDKGGTKYTLNYAIYQKLDFVNLGNLLKNI